MQQDQDWMIDEVVWVPGVRHVVVLSSDGLLKARSAGTPRDVADRLSAACSGLQSLSQSVGREFGAGTKAVRELMVGFDGGYLFARSAGTGTHLVVITEPVVDPRLIAQQMQAQVIKLGERNFSTPARRA
ncbi:roadblock/LC7 domain-containing protein [Nonomuraea sp. NBC_01738]|uniref:roadblock/LC7 domain-containing protein n=1 Tax=Nonomuraea sp. NBC_01738 TaxID=2976003 RepID=UPI002E102C21|nr:roadblock/LC7 domain-containing protein [Nonomuraea sp. NBC_01738]